MRDSGIKTERVLCHLYLPILLTSANMILPGLFDISFDITSLLTKTVVYCSPLGSAEEWI
jgi:hypothetical protein